MTRLGLAAFGLQLVVVAVISITDAIRKRGRPQAGFPRVEPLHSTIGRNRITTYTYGDDLYRDMLAAIRRARRHIYLESYIWKGDALGAEFKTALGEAAERGVAVHAIYDGFANLVVPRSFKRFPPTLHVLEFPAYTPGLRIYDPRRYGRDHRKILVVDDEVGFVGGYNIGDAYVTQWRDTHVRIEGPAVWDLSNAFADFWNLHRRSSHPVLRDEGTPEWQPRIRVHRNVPWHRVFPIRGMYLEAIDRARHRILLTHAYFIPDREILTGLLQASGRGVDVRVLLPATSNHVIADWLARGFYTRLLRGGVRILRYENAMVHAKTATIDGQWSTIGTANVDRMSLTGNYEVNVEFFDEQLAAQMEEIFAVDATNARELTLEEWAGRSVLAKFSEGVLAPLRPLL